MYVFKEINKASTVIESNVVTYTQNLNTSSIGIQSVKIISGSTNNNYWSVLNVLFYTSGSPVYEGENKFSVPINNFSVNDIYGTQFLHKYHGYVSQSVITIPQEYYGESIKRKSFKFTDLKNPDNSGNNPIIVDDGDGNLYSTNGNVNFGTLTASSAGAGSSSISSSQNYVGNIFYDLGVVVLNETGSWSGSVKYPDLAENYTLNFDSVNTITSREYNVTLLPQEFNHTMNYTVRSPISGSLTETTPHLAREFTGSDFNPYITTINLYQKGDETEGPVIQARLPKPVRKSDKVNITFKIKLDT